MRFLTILKFLKIHQKINFWLVLGVIGRSGSQEMSIFEVFEHLKIFENFGNKKNVPGGPEVRGPRLTGLGTLMTRLGTLKTRLGILKTNIDLE